MSVQYCPSLCRKIDSNRHLRRGSTQPCRACLLKIARAYAGKWALTDTFEKAHHGLVEGVWRHLAASKVSRELWSEKVVKSYLFCICFEHFWKPNSFSTFRLPGNPSPDGQTETALSKVSVQYSPSPCRKMDSNRHLRRSINPLRFSFRRYFSRVSAIFHIHFLATLVIDFIEQGIEIFVSSFFLDVPHNGIHSKRKQFWTQFFKLEKSKENFNSNRFSSSLSRKMVLTHTM